MTNQETKTLEQLARDAGWIETPLEECRKGDPVLVLASGVSGIADRLDGYHVAVTQPDSNLAWELGAEPCLRAPRPEPEYKPGTVVWGRLEGEDECQTFIRVDNRDYPWIGEDPDDFIPNSWPEDCVEVHHEIAGPDGSTPAPVLGPVTDEQLLAALDAYARGFREACENPGVALNKESLTGYSGKHTAAMRAALEAYRDTLTTGETEEPSNTAEPARKREPITLERIRAEGREAWTQVGTIWRWNPKTEEFEVRSATLENWCTVASAALRTVTAPGYFTGWADQEDGE